MVEQGSGPMAKKQYVKPEVSRNEPLVDITFATAGPVATLTPTATPPAGTLTGTGPGTVATGVIMTSPKIDGSGAGASLVGSGDSPGGSGLGDDYDTGTLVGSGTIIPGTGGAPGTVL